MKMIDWNFLGGLLIIAIYVPIIIYAIFFYQPPEPKEKRPDPVDIIDFIVNAIKVIAFLFIVFLSFRS